MIERIDLLTGSRGVFTVTLDGEVLFAKHAVKRHAQPGEVVTLVRERLGPELRWT